MAHYAYFDESGSFGFAFHKPNVSTHFVVSGIVFPASSFDAVEKLGEEIGRRFFSGSEIKSSNIGNNDQRRIEILRVALQGNFYIHSMVFDKRAISLLSALRFKRSFIKYFTHLAYENLLLTFSRLHIVADEHGNKEFMDGLRAYLQTKFENKNLFGETEFGFDSSKSNRILQLADLFVGSIARCYDEATKSERREEIFTLLLNSGKLLPIFEWPQRTRPFLSDEPSTTLDKHNSEVLAFSIKKAEQFIADNRTITNEFVPEQLATVQVLLHHTRYGNPREYLKTPSIMRYFKINPLLRIKNKQFGRCVIGRLRDAGVLVTSNTRGYKLVADVADLKQFVLYFHHFIYPMLDRLANYRKLILHATKNELDILEGPDFEYLRKYYDAQ
jgi:hypothetical protein